MNPADDVLGKFGYMRIRPIGEPKLTMKTKDGDDVLAAFVKRFGERPFENEWPKMATAWDDQLVGYRAGHADCAAQGAKDREELANALAMALNILGHPDDAVTIALWKIHDKNIKAAK